MSSIFMVTNNRADRALCLTKDEAFRRIELHLDPGGDDLKLLHLPGALPDLEEHDLQGSQAHKLRYIANKRGTWIEIAEHNPDRIVTGFTTLVHAFDFNTGFDPSYEVQARLYRLQLANEPVDDLANDLRQEISSSLRIVRDEYGHDLKVLNHIKKASELFEGEDMFSGFDGDATGALDRLADIVIDRFIDKATMAFPKLSKSP